LENTEQLHTSSLQCLISTTCISLDRACQALDAIVLLLGSLFLEQLDVQIKHEGRSLPEASSGCNTNTNPKLALISFSNMSTRM